MKVGTKIDFSSTIAATDEAVNFYQTSTHPFINFGFRFAR
jgi:hypothetical protein